MSDTVIASPYMTVAEAASYCRLSVKTIYKHRKEIARMPAVRKLVFRREELDRWLSGRPARTPRTAR